MQYLFARSKSNNSFWFTLYFNCICDFVLKVMEAVYELVLPGNNISHSEIIEQVGHSRHLL